MAYKIKYPDIVAKVRKLWTVDGKKFINDDSFSDERIDKQVRLVMDLNPVPQNKWDSLIREAVNDNKSNPELFNAKDTSKFMKKVLGFEYAVDKQFWANSSSVAYKSKYFRKDAHSFPADVLGLYDAFGESAYESYYTFRNYPDKFVNEVKAILETLVKIKELRAQNSYMFDTADEYIKAIENAQSSIIIDAIKFYRDPNKDMDARIKLFDKFGDDDSCIHSPSDIHLNMIFQLYHEQEYVSRRETVICSSVIKWWIEELESNRVSIDKTNEYHPELKTHARNYIPDQSSLDKIFNRHMNILIAEGTSRFLNDW